MIGNRLNLWRRTASGIRENLNLRAAFGIAQLRIRELAKESEEARCEVAEIQRTLAEQAKQLEALTERIELITTREQELRAMLLAAHDQLMRRADKIKVELAAELQRPAPQESSVVSDPTSDVSPAIPIPEKDLALAGANAGYEQLSKYFSYRRLVDRIREVANAVIPPNATVAVVSKGDEKLLVLGEGRQGWHFPQDEHGVYTGYHPADSAEAIAHLEELRERGAQFLLLPGTSFWWLEHYGELSEHLDGCYRRVWEGEACVLYSLSEDDFAGQGDER
jgi:hypothetical protein